MTTKMSRILSIAAVACSCYLTASCKAGGCLLDHSELTSMDPQISCLNVQGNKPTNSQCVLAAINITNNCSEVLTFAQGDTVDNGKLTFAPGESGRYDADSSMQTSPDLWVTTAALGTQTIKFTIKTYRR